MSFDIQVDDIAAQRTILISEVNPCDPDGGDMNDVNHYYISPDSNPTYAAGKTTVDFSTSSPGWTASEHAEKILLQLDGPGRGRNYTIMDNISDELYLYEDHSSSFLSTHHFAIVHTAHTMYDYCGANDKDCISLSCSDVSFIYGSPEDPRSYANHTTLKISTGKFNQGVSMNNCEVWDPDSRNRMWRLSQIVSLLYKWHKLSGGQPVYLIITVDFLERGSEKTYKSNFPFVYKYTADSTINNRGYCKGYPMEAAGKLVYSPVFKVPFKEAWTL